jgi:orotate phosphoribosyltransferase
MNTIRERLLEILRRDCLLRGRFKLASGAETDTYLDCRKLWRSPTLGVVSRVLLDLVESLSFSSFDTVGTLGAGSVLLGSFLTRWRMGFGRTSTASVCATSRRTTGCKAPWMAG